MLSDMFKDLIDYLIIKFEELIHSRLVPLGLVFFVMFGALVSHLFTLQIIEGESAQEQYTQTTKKTLTLASTRGNIYDRNGTLLAYNRMVYVVTVTDTGDYSNGYQKNLMLLRLIDILQSHDETLTTTVPIVIDSSGHFNYTVEGNTLLRFLRDMYGLKTIDDFTDEKPADTTAEEAFAYMKDHYGVGKYSSKSGDTYEVSDADALACINLRFSMSTNSYQKYVSTEAASDISSETMQEILEHSTELLGVDVEEDYVREYPNSECFSSIIGYTGAASSDDIEELNADGENKYSSGDIIGKTGIESSFESDLQGTKGERVIYVDSEGHVTSEVSQTDPVSGSDVYLTIDADLQVGIYHLLEQQLAGILLDKIVDSEVKITTNMKSSAKKISISKVYYHLLSNNVLDMDHFSASDASDNEKKIYSVFSSEKEDILAELNSQLTASSPKNYEDLPEDTQTYMTYIYTALKNAGVLLTDKIDTNDDIYQQYRTDETMSLKEFLQYALKQSWIDTSQLDLSEKYTSAEETYAALVSKISELLSDDSDFDKTIYEQLIKSGAINPCTLCLCLFDQGVLENDDDAIASLSSGSSETAYLFIRKKIRSLEITPAQLALDPCTAAFTLVDPNSGEVLAMVSYPGYDSNRISDSSYYYSLTQDQSAPLYSTATQTRTAPGSTFKLCSTIAGMTEGVITASTKITCNHVFTKQGLNLACTGTHGSINVTYAIQRSCNVFFSEVGYELSLNSKGVYSGSTGISMIQKYADMVGLGTKSGVEVTEMEPHVSDQNPIPSAIGQGTHAYANVQLARYATTLANSGTVYDLTLLDKVIDVNGFTTTNQTPSVAGTCDTVASTTWDVVHEGMYEVTHNGEHAKEFDKELKIAGKTGTAEENKLRPNHATFVGYAPYDDPTWSFACTIPFGYSSTYSSRLCNSVMQLVEGTVTLEDIIGSSATSGSGSSLDVD